MDTASQSRVGVCIHKPDLFRLRVVGGARDPVVVPTPFNVNETGNPGMCLACWDSGGRDSRRETLEDAVGTYLGSTGVEGNVTNKYASVTSNGYSSI